MNILKFTNGHEEEILDCEEFYHPFILIDDDFEKSGYVFWCQTCSGQYVLEEIVLRDGLLQGRSETKLLGGTKTYLWKKFNEAYKEYLPINNVIEAVVDTAMMGK